MTVNRYPVLPAGSVIPDHGLERSAGLKQALHRSPGAARSFWRNRRGALSVETAVTIAMLVFVFAGLMEIVHSAYVSDTMERAARAAARAVALAPQDDARSGTLDTVACTAIRRELDLAESFDCGTHWTLTVDTDLTPAAMLAGGGGTGDEAAGEMVVVRIAWSQEPWELGWLVAALDEEEEALQAMAVGVARRETVQGG